ncbi:MAG: FtsK/SpoIIIE domain-containing protein [Anaerorhabdus sp.]
MKKKIKYSKLKAKPTLLQKMKMIMYFFRDKNKYDLLKNHFADLKIIYSIFNMMVDVDKESGKKMGSIYYSLSSAGISLKIKFYKATSETPYNSFKTALETQLVKPCSTVELIRGGAKIDVFYHFNAKANYSASENGVVVGEGVIDSVVWNYNKEPHALVCGKSGSGKTTFIKGMISSILSADYKVYCLDGKGVDYSSYDYLFEEYRSTTKQSIKECVSLFEEVHQIMLDRYVEMDKFNDYRDIELKPIFFLIDEFLVFVALLSKEDKDIVHSIMTSIVLKGRAAGVHVIPTLQRPDARYLGGEVRSNIGFKVCLGSADESTYSMMFDQNLKPFEQGLGWYSQGTFLGVVGVPYCKIIQSNQKEEIVFSEIEENTVVPEENNE